jgi:hypothetical protein
MQLGLTIMRCSEQGNTYGLAGCGALATAGLVHRKLANPIGNGQDVKSAHQNNRCRLAQTMRNAQTARYSFDDVIGRTPFT